MALTLKDLVRREARRRASAEPPAVAPEYVPPTDLYQAVAQKGQPNGYAGLDVDGKVPTAQLPPGNGGSADGKVIYGTGAPGSGTGADGDSYVDRTAGVLYGPKASGAWPGTTVPLGGAGDGQLLFGAGAPGGGVGKNGDSYVDTTNHNLYGPKASGAWPGSFQSFGGGGGAPSGAAGGVLGGTYPNPSFAADMATQAELDAHIADTTAVHGISDMSRLVGASEHDGTSYPAPPTGVAITIFFGPTDPADQVGLAVNNNDMWTGPTP